MFSSLLAWLLHKGKDVRSKIFVHSPSPILQPEACLAHGEFSVDSYWINTSKWQSFLSPHPPFLPLVRMICENPFQNSKSLFWSKISIRMAPKEKKQQQHSQILTSSRNWWSLGGEHQMRAFISPLVQLLSNIDQSFIFFFSWNPMRSFSNSVFISRLEELQEEPPLKCTFSIFITPNYQHLKVLRQDVQVSSKNCICIRILNSVWWLYPLMSCAG